MHFVSAIPRFNSKSQGTIWQSIQEAFINLLEHHKRMIVFKSPYSLKATTCIHSGYRQYHSIYPSFCTMARTHLTHISMILEHFHKPCNPSFVTPPCQFCSSSCPPTHCKIMTTTFLSCALALPPSHHQTPLSPAVCKAPSHALSLSLQPVPIDTTGCDTIPLKHYHAS